MHGLPCPKDGYLTLRQKRRWALSIFSFGDKFLNVVVIAFRRVDGLLVCLLLAAGLVQYIYAKAIPKSGRAAVD